MNEKLQQLKARLGEIDDLHAAAALLHWDQATYMPQGGAPARGRQLATLERLAHEKLTDPAIGELLDDLQPGLADLPPDADETGLVRISRRAYERAVKVPCAFTARLADHVAETYQAWTIARPANDFAAVRPRLEKTLDLSRELAGFYPGYEHIADPLIDRADEGMTVRMVSALFDELRAELVPLVQEACERKTADDAPLRAGFPIEAQFAFGREIVGRFGYDWTRGRQDETHHPFMTKFSLGDVRITTRARFDDLGDALFSTLHEAGHALYEQGIDPSYEGTPLADGASMAVHESQSRLWENLVGRSLAFWRWGYPLLQDEFPTQLQDVSLDEFYRAANRVERSLIRTDADELTYNLHVMIRFDLELQMLDGRLEVRDLPEAWRERYRSDLGLTPPDDKDGCLQDVHWFAGTIGGAFQGYTIGNILSAAFFDAAIAAHPDIPTQIEKGEFGTLHNWLKQNIYRHGSKWPAPVLIERVLGGPLSIAPYIGYLKRKYGALYGFEAG